VFLTGATGFIGSYLVPELVHAGHQVVGLTRRQLGWAPSGPGLLADLRRLDQSVL
jgi:nucleoside-diphosphate-sugar epimerase